MFIRRYLSAVYDKSKLTKGWLSVERGNCVCEECAKRKMRTHTSARLYLDESAMYTLQYILTAPIGRLYTFCLEEPVKRTLYDLTVKWRRRYFSREFKSLQVLEEMVHFMGTFVSHFCLLFYVIRADC